MSFSNWTSSRSGMTKINEWYLLSHPYISIHLLSSVSPPIRTSLALLISEVSILSLASLSELSFSLAPVSITEFAEKKNKISNYFES